MITSGASNSLSAEDKKKPVAVLLFENQTTDSHLDPLGMMAMDWISKGLIEGADAAVIKGENSEATSSNWKKWAGSAEILIRGRYYIRGESDVVFTADIVDASSDKVMFSVDPMTGKSNDPMEALVALQQKVIGYWKLNGSYPGKPPRYDAYRTYFEAVQMNEAPPYTKSIPLLEKAQSLDTTFADPLFSLYFMYRYGLKRSGEESVMERLRERAPLYSPYHQLRLKAQEARYEGDLARTAEIFWQIYQTYKQDNAAESAITGYCQSNHLQKTIDLYESYQPITPDTTRGYAFGRYVTELYGLGRYQEVLDAFDALSFSPSRISAILARLKSLIQLDRIDELDEMMAFYKDHPLEHGGWESYSHLHAVVCATLYLMDRDDVLPRYLEAALDWMENEETLKANLDYLKGVMYFIAGDYEKAYQANIVSLDKYDLVPFMEVAGASLIKMGKTDEVDPFINMLKERYVTGFTPYSIGVIESYRNHEEAIKWLKISTNEAIEWDFWNYRNDAMLKVLRDHPDFIALTEPK